MTEIVDIPETLPLNPFPHVDDPEDSYNQEAYEVGLQLPPAIARVREIAVAARTVAIAASEKAAAADLSRAQAANWSAAAADDAVAAMSYRNQAGAHASSSATQAGIAATKAGDAAASADAAEQKVALAAQEADRAKDEADRAQREADRAEVAAASIADGPIPSITVHSGLKTGAVTLALSDMGALATDAQMQAGTATAPMLMSPAGIKAAVLANSRIQRVARTANTQLISTDSGKLIDITAGTFTQTFLAPAALGAGWWCYLQNSGTGDITISASDGRTNWIMYPGEVRLFQCDGTALRSVVLNSFYKVFTASGTFTKPPGYIAFDGMALSGAQSGAKSGSTTIAADGGRGGGCFPFSIGADRFSTSTVITIGSGGAASTSLTQNAGGNTTLGSLLTVYGAGVAAANIPGSVLRVTVVSGGAFTGSGGVNADGLSSVYGGGNVNLPSSEQGSSVYGGAAGGCVSNSGSAVSTAGTSAFAGNGGAASSSASGTDGAVPSGGGGATQTGATSGAGARGELRIWGVK